MDPGFIERRKQPGVGEADVEAAKQLAVLPAAGSPVTHLGDCRSCFIVRPLRSKHCEHCNRYTAVNRTPNPHNKRYITISAGVNEN